MSLALWRVAHRLPHTASCVCVCVHSAPESNTASSSLRSGNIKTSFSWAVGLGKNVHVISQTVRTCMQISCTHEAPFTARLSSVPQPQLSALTRHSGTLSWRHGSAGLLHTGRSTLSCVHKTACVRARTRWHWTHNTVTFPSPFQVSSLWRSGGWVQEDDSNPQRLLLVRPETSICHALQIPSRPRRLPKASLWSVNRDWQRHDAGRQTV